MTSKPALTLAAYQPDIPQNTGAFIRLCAGFDVTLDIIEPCGFVWDERKIKQSALDYYDHIQINRHSSWEQFLTTVKSRRLVLLTTKAAIPYTDFTFNPDDILIVGRESAGVPDDVHARADARIIIPMSPVIRSFNVAMSAAIVISEAKRQLNL